MNYKIRPTIRRVKPIKQWSGSLSREVSPVKKEPIIQELENELKEVRRIYDESKPTVAEKVQKIFIGHKLSPIQKGVIEYISKEHKRNPTNISKLLNDTIKKLISDKVLTLSEAIPVIDACEKNGYITGANAEEIIKDIKFIRPSDAKDALKKYIESQMFNYNKLNNDEKSRKLEDIQKEISKYIDDEMITLLQSKEVITESFDNRYINKTIAIQLINFINNKYNKSRPFIKDIFWKKSTNVPELMLKNFINYSTDELILGEIRQKIEESQIDLDSALNAIKKSNINSSRKTNLINQITGEYKPRSIFEKWRRSPNIKRLKELEQSNKSNERIRSIGNSSVLLLESLSAPEITPVLEEKKEEAEAHIERFFNRTISLQEPNGLSNPDKVCWFNSLAQILRASNQFTYNLPYALTGDMVNEMPNFLNLLYSLRGWVLKNTQYENNMDTQKRIAEEMQKLLNVKEGDTYDASTLYQQFIDKLNKEYTEFLTVKTLKGYINRKHSVRNKVGISIPDTATNQLYDIIGDNLNAEIDRILKNNIDIIFTPFVQQHKLISIKQPKDNIIRFKDNFIHEQPLDINEDEKQVVVNYYNLTSAKFFGIEITDAQTKKDEEGKFDIEVREYFIKFPETISDNENSFSLCGIIYYKKQLGQIGHYFSITKYNNTWFFCSDDEIASGNKILNMNPQHKEPDDSTLYYNEETIIVDDAYKQKARIAILFYQRIS